MRLWIHAVALLIYGGQHPIEHKSPLDEGHPTTSDPSAIHLQNYQLVIQLPIGIARSKIHRIYRLYIVLFTRNQINSLCSFPLFDFSYITFFLGERPKCSAKLYALASQLGECPTSPSPLHKKLRSTSWSLASFPSDDTTSSIQS